jgi:hypothetical protein
MEQFISIIIVLWLAVTLAILIAFIMMISLLTYYKDVYKNQEEHLVVKQQLIDLLTKELAERSN